MRKIVVAAGAAGLAVVLLFVSDLVVAHLTPAITTPHAAPWLKIGAPAMIALAALPAIVRRIRKHGFFSVEI